MRFGKNISRHFLRRTVRDRKPKLRIGRCRLDIGMRMRFDTRIDTNQHILDNPSFFRLPLNEIGFRMRINDNHADARIKRLFNLVRELIVTVHGDLVRRKSCAKCGIQLSSRYNIHADSLRTRNRIHGFTRKRLGCVKNKSLSLILRIDGILINSHHTANIRLIKHIERRGELLGKCNTICAADFKMSLFINFQCISCMNHSIIISQFLGQGQ